MKIQNTKFFSVCNGTISKGCKQCVKGEKLVLYITGLCTENCYFCPLSDKRKDKDIIWANELKVKRKSDVIKEAKLCSSKGAGITGGDPLLKIDRTIKYIKLLKQNFGKKFHIHLYTPLALVDEKKLLKLFNSGLDEIRFHPHLNKEKEWNKLKFAKKFRWKVGIEIPVIPTKEKEIIKLVDYSKKLIHFINLNELEISDNNKKEFDKRKFFQKNDLSYGVKNSEKVALKIIKYCNKIKLNAHYCPTKLKDKVQMGNRFKRRAKNIAKEYDIITKEGLLYRGTIEFEMKLKNKNLSELRKKFMRKYNIPTALIELDKTKTRINIAPWILNELKEELHKDFPNCKFAIVEEYPTCDLMAVDIEYL